LQEVQIQLHNAQSSTGAAHGDAQFSKVYLETQAALDANRWSSAYSSARLREIVRRQSQFAYIEHPRSFPYTQLTSPWQLRRFTFTPCFAVCRV
jgi:hypothetical protein